MRFASHIHHRDFASHATAVGCLLASSRRRMASLSETSTRSWRDSPIIVVKNEAIRGARRGCGEEKARGLRYQLFKFARLYIIIGKLSRRIFRLAISLTYRDLFTKGAFAPPVERSYIPIIFASLPSLRFVTTYSFPRDASGAISVLRKERKGGRKEPEEKERATLSSMKGLKGDPTCSVRGGRSRSGFVPTIHPRQGAVSRASLCVCVHGGAHLRARALADTLAHSVEQSTWPMRLIVILEKKGGRKRRLGRRIIIIKVTRSHNHSNGYRPTGRPSPRRGQKRKRISNSTQTSVVTLECANSR